MARFVEDAKRVFLGFVDEKITEKFESGVDFMTSKIGGSAVNDLLVLTSE